MHVEQDNDGELDARQQEQQDGGGRFPEGFRNYLLRLTREIHDDDELNDGNGEQQYRYEDVLLEGGMPSAAVFSFVS